MNADLEQAISFHDAIVAEGGKALVGYDTAKALERSSEEAVYFIADRIKALVAAERLEGAGNLDWWTYGEVRLPKKKGAVAAAAASRARETTDQGT